MVDQVLPAIQVLPSGEGLFRTPSQCLRSLSPFETTVWLYRVGVGAVLLQGPYAQHTRCGNEWVFS